MKEKDSLNSLSEGDKLEQLVEIKRNLEDAFAKGKINELHYTLLKEKASTYEKD